MKLDGTTIGDAEDLDLVMLLHNLLECCSNYSDTRGSLKFYSKDEVTNFDIDIAYGNFFKSFKYKVKLLSKTIANGVNGILKNKTIAVQLK